MSTVTEPQTRRGRGAERRPRDRRGGVLTRQSPWAQPSNPYRPFEILSADELESIHLAALDILERIGISVQSDRARALCRANGCEILADGQRVRFPREVVMAAIAKAPSRFGMVARAAIRDIQVGGNAAAFRRRCPSSSARWTPA